MPAPRTGWRFAIVMLLSLSLLGALAPQPATAQHEEMATVTIHSRFCPPGYDGNDIFEDCHDNPGIQGVQFGIRGPRNASGTPGVSEAVSTTCTPGRRSASLVSILTMRAWTRSVRRIFPTNMPGSSMS